MKTGLGEICLIDMKIATSLLFRSELVNTLHYVNKSSEERCWGIEVRLFSLLFDCWNPDLYETFRSCKLQIIQELFQFAFNYPELWLDNQFYYEFPFFDHSLHSFLLPCICPVNHRYILCLSNLQYIRYCNWLFT